MGLSVDGMGWGVEVGGKSPPLLCWHRKEMEPIVYQGMFKFLTADEQYILYKSLKFSSFPSRPIGETEHGELRSNFKKRDPSLQRGGLRNFSIFGPPQ